MSAPTSFGKSLLIDASIATGQHKDILVCVPTIALIDETRRRLAKRFGSRYRVLTHPSQERADKNIFVLTQERALDLPTTQDFSLFVLDEFYKLRTGEADESRSALLNELLYRILRTSAQFYLLGPSIKEISDGFDERYSCKFIRTTFATVACDVIHYLRPKGKYERLVELCNSLDEPTLIYCASPPKARKVAEALLAAKVPAGPGCPEAATWVAKHFHPEWLLVRALQSGIGIHHGAVPRALAQFMVRSFNDARLRFLVCTSTLIEGVNTAAKNVIVFDNTISTTKYDFFTFNNIKGRSGRMHRHFVGRVYLFENAPQEELPLVDIPFFAQEASTPDSLLIQLDKADLNDRSKARVEQIESKSVLRMQTIRANRGIEPDRQVAAAEEIISNLGYYSPLLTWSGFPSKAQRECVMKLIWDYLAVQKGSGVTTAKQLSFKVSKMAANSGLRDLIENDIKNPNPKYRLSPSDACESNLSFVRNWMSFRLPRLLRALDLIQKDVLSQHAIEAGSYEFYASKIENLFIGQAAVALDEYGLPMELLPKLRKYVDPSGTLDDAIRGLKRMPSQLPGLTPFERELVLDTVEHL